MIPLASTTKNTTVYVTDTAAPQIVQIRGTRPGSHSTATITYGRPPALTAPPASQTIDGSAYGF